jgi:hypothetical protein
MEIPPPPPSQAPIAKLPPRIQARVLFDFDPDDPSTTMQLKKDQIISVFERGSAGAWSKGENDMKFPTDYVDFFVAKSGKLLGIAVSTN